MGYHSGFETKPLEETWTVQIPLFFSVLCKFSKLKTGHKVFDEINALHAKSDEELAALGLSRDQINQVVMRQYLDE